MMEESHTLKLAHSIQRHTRRAGYLIPGLRQALLDLGRPELAEILDLIHEDVTEARRHVEGWMAAQQKVKHLRVLVDLHQMGRLGGPKAQRVAQRVARRMAG